MTVMPTAIGHTGSGSRFAWVAVLFGVWLLVGLAIVTWALNSGRADDAGFSPYHIPAYLCLLALGGTSLYLAFRATRQDRRWLHAFPPGYGSLGAGLLALLAFVVVDVGWREGVGIARGIETALAPSRILLSVGVFLVLVAPFRAALRSTEGGTNRWPAVLSASLVLALTGIGGFHPAQNPWLEHVFVWPPADIWIMNSDGSHQTRLITSGEGVQAWEGVWSPNGREMAYTVMRKGDRPPVDLADEADVWIASADGTNARPVAAGERWQWLPHWSPNGRWIVYTDESEGGPWAPSGPVGPESGGSLMGFLGQRTPERQPADIWRVLADGSGPPQRLTDAPGDDRAATYSPDGTKLAFDSTRDGNTEIYIMDADGSNPRRLTNDPGEDWGATWSPDGRQIAFNSGRTGDGEIYVIGVDGSGLKRLTNEPGTHDFAPTWSPDGSRIVFRRDPREPGAQGEIWSMAAADGSDPRNLTQTTSSGEDIPSGGGAWSVDGRIIFARFQDPLATEDPLIRESLGSAAMLLVAVLLSLGAVVVRMRPPFGSFTLIMGITTLLAAGTSDQWRFVPAAIASGLIVDVLVRYAPTNRKAQVAGAGLASALVLSAGAAVVLTSGLGWSPTLLVGVAFASGALGWAVGGLVGGPVMDTETGEPA